MLNDLTTSLRTILADTDLPALIHDSDIAFDRPADTYSPGKTTINLFLYDVRENVELRSSEPVVERKNGVATISQPPLRVACSYQITAWIDSSSTGEQAILAQHQLLGEVLRVFARMPTIDPKYLQGELANSLYPVTLVTAQAELVRNPAEFWTAMGGKLRPSFTVTASFAMDRAAPPVVAPAVSSSALLVTDSTTGIAETVFRIGGHVRDANTHLAIAAVELSLTGMAPLPDVRVQARSNADGQFGFSGLAAGSYTLQAVKPGYAAKSRTVQVPGKSPTSFDVDL
jgi:hypothetical protein